jgi:hypothetical protein
MFRLCRERHARRVASLSKDRKIEFTEVWIDAEVLCRDDGFKLIQIDKQVGSGVHFRYAKGDIVFDFTANREHWGGATTGTYGILLHLTADQCEKWPRDRSKVQEIAADIDAALRAWPTPSGQESIPIGVISFFVRIVGQESGIPRLPDYRLTFGRPVVLRDVPTTIRWQPQTISHRVPLISVPLGSHHGEIVKDCEALIRDDGVRLIRFKSWRGPENDGNDQFNFSDRDISFDFKAERRLSRALVSDTWEVQLDPPGVKGLSPALRAQLGAERCTEIVQSIEEALYAWPPEEGLGDSGKIPVNRVVFLDAQYRGPPETIP